MGSSGATASHLFFIKRTLWPIFLFWTKKKLGFQVLKKIIITRGSRINKKKMKRKREKKGLDRNKKKIKKQEKIVKKKKKKKQEKNVKKKKKNKNQPKQNERPARRP